MPNWCYTQLTVSGQAEEINRFAEGLEKGKDDEKNYSIMMTYFPTPDADNWYDWNVANWGSKWADKFGCYDKDDKGDFHSLSFNFETAWSPITEGVRFVSSLFPTLVFAMSYEEESSAYVGAEVHKAGETLFFRQEEPPFPDQKDDEDDDTYYERIDGLRHDIMDAITTEADKIEGGLLAPS